MDDHTLVTANKLNSKISEYNNVIQVLERHLKSESYSKNEVDKKKQETLIEFWTKMNNVGTTTDVKKVTSGVAFDAVIDYLKKELEKMETEFSKL